jgi:hypothetical protein
MLLQLAMLPQDGSSVVSSMSGSTDDKMAEAVENASHVIICVSKNYKESANCRQEALYTNQKYKNGLLKIIYVMVDQQYTTVSRPHSCDVSHIIGCLLLGDLTFV